MSSSETFDVKKPPTPSASTGKGASTSSGVKVVLPVTDNPLALASHDEVVKDRTLFMNTLYSFHFSIGSKLVIPVVGGKDLDLHVLYVQVTNRGGYEKVVKEKKWREVGSAFGLPNTATSASYALRKHYLMLLHRYELVYYLRKNVDASDKQAGEETFFAVGTIEGKFDCGYLITVKFGGETYSGVLYYPEIGSAGSLVPSQTLTPSAQLPPRPPVPHAPLQLRRRSRKRRSEDPDRPKTNRSGYNFFFRERHTALKSVIPEREREFTRMIGKAWTDLPKEQKQVYNTYAVTDKERYRKELQEYREKKGKGNSKAIA